MTFTYQVWLYKNSDNINFSYFFPMINYDKFKMLDGEQYNDLT